MGAPSLCRSRPSCVLGDFECRSGSRSRFQYLADNEGAFPRRRQLVLAGCSLDQLEHKVALLERSRPDLPVVISAQALLVDAGPAECQQPALFQQIDTVLTCFFCFFLGVHGDSRRVELYVRWDDGFSTVDEEEGCESG